MKTKVKSIIAMIFMLAIIGIGSKVQAASASINASTTSATVGESVTITVNINAAAWNLEVTGNAVSGGHIVGYDQEGANTSTTKTYSLSTSTAGTYTVYLTGDVTDGSTDENTSISTSVTVKVSNPTPVTPQDTSTSNSSSTNTNSGTSNSSTSSSGSSNSGSSSSSSNSSNSSSSTTTTTQKETKSDDSSLKALVVEGYDLYPEFDAATREYNVRVTNDITTVTVVPTVNNTKASYEIQGTTEDLVVGKNVITVVVTAEDGTTSNYVINVTREREGLNLQYIKIFYTDEEGNKQELSLNPEFSTEIFEYTLNDVSYLVSKLEVEVLANLEQANIEVTGNEELVEGTNTITITVTVPSESEEEVDEVLIYNITVNKEAEQSITLIGRISNWFNENIYKILIGALILCLLALAGLSVYLVIDYKKYKMVVEKVAEMTRINNVTTANTSETIQEQVTSNEVKDEEGNINDNGKHF